VPETWDEVRRLPGVGDYTAGAILSIAFGQAVPAVDGNVMRVLSRINMVLDDISKPATRKQFDRLARDLLPGVNPGQLNQALMELGATVCTPAKPRCETCPVQHHCRAFAAGVAASLPVKPKKQAVRAITLATVIVVRGDRLLIVRRPTDGIWGGLWAFPSVELAPTADLNEQQSALASALAAVGIEATIGAQVQSRRHTLTHRQLEIPVYRAHHTMGEPDPTIGAWVTPAQAREYALPVPFQLMVAALDPGPLFLAAEREQGEYNSKPTLTGGSPPNGS
jgi:A/G-specific adenine glycosylase